MEDAWAAVFVLSNGSSLLKGSDNTLWHCLEGLCTPFDRDLEVKRLDSSDHDIGQVALQNLKVILRLSLAALF